VAVDRIQSGKAAYQLLDANGSNRWGDYSFTTLDPSDDFSMWTIQEYAEALLPPPGDGSGNRSNWGTVVAELKQPAPTLDNPKAKVKPGSVGNVINLTGTGFYDPGPGFPN